MKYAAFLRGINVGGHKKVPMKRLREVLEENGFEDVETFIASGNMLFEAKKQQPGALAAKISKILADDFGFGIPVIVVEAAELQDMVRVQPFKKVKVTPDTRLYITFLSEQIESQLDLPYVSADKSFTIRAAEGRIVYSVLDVSQTGTPDAMNILEKTYGKNITTRNWNTIVKMVDALS